MTRKQAAEVLRCNTDLGYGIIIENESIKSIYEALDMAIKELEQEPKIKVLDHDEVARKLGTVDIYMASAWTTLLKDLEYLGMKICEVEDE